MKLIDKDALIAKIKKRQSEHDKRKYDYASFDHFWASVEDGKILFLIDTLEVKEVNLENIATVEWDNYIRKIDGEPDAAYMLIKRNEYIELAKHFFELGLKAQKKE